jgi:DNA modification methylase
MKKYLNKIIQGDCLEVMKGMPDKSVDLIIADPPYNLGIDYGTTTDDNKKDYDKWFLNLVKECKRISNKILITPGIHNVGLAKVAKPDWVGCWWKPAAMGHCFVGVCNWEPIFIWGKPNKQINDVFRAPIIPDKMSEGHPCPKPIHLFRDFISKFTNEKDIVLDPFIGSGTTAVAAKYTNRNFIGIEISPEYCKIAKQRLAQEVLI